MADRNISSLNKSLNTIEDDLKISHTTVDKYLNKDDLFKKSFNPKSYYNEVEQAKQRNKVDENKNRFKINAAIYDVLLLCIKNFKHLRKLKRKFISAELDKSKRTIKGSEILEYNNTVINDIDNLKPFLKKLVLNQKAVKYSFIMNKYYDKFLDKISVLSTICTDENVTKSPAPFANMLTHLDEVIWYYNLERRLNRKSNDPTEFNINFALKKAIAILDNADKTIRSKKDTDYYVDELSCVSTELYKEIYSKLENEYYDEIETILCKSDEYEGLDDFYKALDNDVSLFNENYHITYRNLFLQYALKTDYKSRYETQKCFIGYSTDIYGRTMLPCILENIDKETENIDEYIKLLSEEKFDEIKKRVFDGFKDCFLPVVLINDRFFVDCKVKIENADKMITEIFANNSKLKTNELTQIIFDFSLYFEGQKTKLDELTISNLPLIHYYAKYCSGITNFWRFNNHIEVVNEFNFNSIEQIKSDKTYKEIKCEIDTAIAYKWAEEIFK